MNNLYNVYEYRCDKKKKKFDFKTKKENTLNSLKDVEYLLNNCKQLSKYFKFYKILK